MPKLNVGRLVRASINLSPLAAPRRNFGILLAVGDSDVIDPVERIRKYTGIEAVAEEFGLAAPEYKAALLYFGQKPQPRELHIGRWLRTASAGLLKGATLTTAERAMTNFTGIVAGSFSIAIDGAAPVDVTGLDFSGALNLNGVAAIIDAALVGASCAWTGSRFVIKSDTTGTASSVGYASAAGSGADVSGLLKLTAATALPPVPGMGAETPAECAAALMNVSGQWFGLSFAASEMPNGDELEDVAALIEASTLDRIFGVTETDTRVLDGAYAGDLATRFRDLGYRKTCVQYAANPFAVCSMMGRGFSVDFNANRSTITLMYKQEPGIVAEELTETQAQTLKTKRCNVFAAYDNDTAIIQYGVMSGQAYFDEIHGLAWFKDALQNALYNTLYQSRTKIPQTDAGQNRLVTVAAKVCDEAVNNGLVAPGVWNADGFGELEDGDTLPSGYYIYAEPMALQPQAIREQRIAPPMQIALKLAGAIHEIDAIVNVNR
ncbi:MAG TPA: DUF3383 domain-containing protein [Acidimicrobiales bacterium]|nr:DUF3383 domain-containing protein [Acidimicrobiales bacterium]